MYKKGIWINLILPIYVYQCLYLNIYFSCYRYKWIFLVWINLTFAFCTPLAGLSPTMTAPLCDRNRRHRASVERVEPLLLPSGAASAVVVGEATCCEAVAAVRRFHMAGSVASALVALGALSCTVSQRGRAKQAACAVCLWPSSPSPSPSPFPVLGRHSNSN